MTGSPNADSLKAESLKATIDELAGHCFGCGPSNPQGLHLSFTLAAPLDGKPLTATARFSLTRLHEGAPGFVHGGIIATLLDEAMSKLNRPLDALAMTRHMEVDYLRPAPVGEPLVLVGRHVRRDGRKLFHEAELQRSDGSLLARGKGLFIVLDADRVAAARMHLPVAD